jgi:hypothetical protein
LAQTPPGWERFSEQEQPMFRLNVCSDLAQVVEHHPSWQPMALLTMTCQRGCLGSMGVLLNADGIGMDGNKLASAACRVEKTI